ncbi:MAG TPA: hypothetical protein VFR70_02670, partial [Flavobacterium sp.]|nr:hypothetical protein [Flavobacterium sp.]
GIGAASFCGAPAQQKIERIARPIAFCTSCQAPAKYNRTCPYKSAATIDYFDHICSQIITLFYFFDHALNLWYFSQK